MEEGYTYRKLIKDLERLRVRFPFLRIESIGQTVMGRQIMAVRIGTGQREIHYNAALHANEWITAPLLMRFLEESAFAYVHGTDYRSKDMRRIFSQNSLWLIPMVNPDGVELVQKGICSNLSYARELIMWNRGSLDFHNWKSNVRGVDLNDQFPAYWEEERIRRGLQVQGPSDFGGEAPLSEPESAALACFTCLHDFQLVIALHTQGREIYWNYRDMEPLCSQAIADHFALVSGYKAVKLTESDAGYKDWFIQEFSKPGFTVEVGLGTNPLPAGMLPCLYEEAVDILLAGLEA
jgi:g-D-glutamyl-meso-diaminopimelate peptidase